MADELQEKPKLADGRGGPPVFMEQTINRLKNRLEERRARSGSVELWEGMIEDCEILLKHFESDHH